ncbi:MAG TPA: hypothetical protein PKY87_10515 [Terricaulis sp.]|nr:hypothetical protein [Terricaulis sp.]
MRTLAGLLLALTLGACDQAQMMGQQQPDPYGQQPQPPNGQQPFGQMPDFAQHQGQQLQNPYCSVPTYQNNSVPYRGFAMIGPNGPVIYIRQDGMSDQNLYRFILAHECGHHAEGHVNSQPRSQEENNQRELAADCWAARTIAGQLDSMALQAAFNDANTQGPFGQQRNAMIQQCAASMGGQGLQTPPQQQPQPFQQRPGF